MAVEPATRQATIKMEQQQLFVVTLGSQEGAFIRDVTFMYDTSIQKIKPAESNSNESDGVIVYKQTRNIIIMRSCGYLYHEEMNE